ncbi:MAG: hypothetical protein WC428_08005 [Candidatus Paceibacterota bacterium]|jgi:hypothetical protein
MEPSVEYIYASGEIGEHFQQYNSRCLGMLNGDAVRVIYDESGSINVDWQPKYAMKRDKVTYTLTCSRSQWKDILARFKGTLKEIKKKVWNHEA